MSIQPLTTHVINKSYRKMLVLLGLCNPQGVKYFSFVNVPAHVPYSIARYQAYLTHTERLHIVGCGFKSNIIRLLSLGTGVHCEPNRNRNACHKYMYMIVRRIASKRMTDVRDKFAKKAEELCASGQFWTAYNPLIHAISMGKLSAYALKAWLHINGRVGVAEDKKKAFELAKKGADLGCHHSKGVLAWCYWGGYGCKKDYAQSLKLARESSDRGSKYGQITLGELHHWGLGGLVSDWAQGVVFFRLAAEQGLDSAQGEMGGIYESGEGVTKDYTEAIRFYQLAANQGYPTALEAIAYVQERIRSLSPRSKQFVGTGASKQ
jgi:TPR repeat protein